MRLLLGHSLCIRPLLPEVGPNQTVLTEIMDRMSSDFSYCDVNKETKDSFIGHITVYEYGKLFSPTFHKRASANWRPERSTQGSKFMDRPKLISKIYHLLNIHRLQRRKNLELNTKCSSKIHKSIQKAIRVCFEENIGESKLYPVGSLFLELFQCHGNSTAIFSILADGLSMSQHVMHRETNILYPSNASKEDNKRAFEYYVQHVCSCELVNDPKSAFKYFLDQEIEPFTCLSPIAAAVQKRDPDLILTLLRYGADPFLSLADPTYEERIRDPTELLIDDLNGLYLFKNTGFAAETKAKLASEEAKVFTCLTYIQRSVIDIPLTASNHIITSFDDLEGEEPGVIQLNEKAYNLNPGILDGIPTSLFIRPASLQHLCRCAIRTILKSNRSQHMLSIPKSISFLPLPSQIKNYLDLQLD